MNIFNLVLLLVSVVLVSCKEYTPVFLWNTKVPAISYPKTFALETISTDYFTDYLLKRVKNIPLILVFVEENLSVEDFSWRDVNDNGAFPLMSNITKSLKDTTFLSSVHNPYKGLRKLINHGYSWKYYDSNTFNSLHDDEKAIVEVKLSEPDYLEDRPDMLRKHDEQIAEVYNEALSHQPFLVVYTGNYTSWIDADLGRFKREEEDTNNTNRIIITDEKNVVIMSATPPIVYKEIVKNEKPMVINITKVIGIPTIKEVKDSRDNLILRVRFSFDEKDNSIDFAFTSHVGNWWTLNSANLTELKQFNLAPTESIGAPSNYSYFCNPTVTFTNGIASLTFENFRVQPRVGKSEFGPVIHCVPYFSIGIWSGLVVVFILSIVLASGLAMIMDINTNDRFDDPKGKTITVTASD